MTTNSHLTQQRFIRYKTIFLSDVHLGTPDCKITEVNDFLRRTRCEKLVLNGDIIDSWHLRRKPQHWTGQHTRFIRMVLRKMEKDGTEVIYLRGNHDDELRRFMPLRLSKLHICNEHIHDNPNGKYMVIHGDVFDQVTTEIFVLGNEVRFATDFDQHADFAVVAHEGVDHAFLGITVTFVAAAADSFDAEPVDGGFHITVGFFEGGFAIHHARVGFVAEFFNESGCNFCHSVNWGVKD